MGIGLSLCLVLVMASETRDGNALCKDQNVTYSKGYSSQERVLPMDKTPVTLMSLSVEEFQGNSLSGYLIRSGFTNTKFT